jgi:NAD(P) transhydrogenase subunit alpha
MTDSANTVTKSAADIAAQAEQLAQQASALAAQASLATESLHSTPFIVTGLTVFVLACFVGYHVVWRVTPALHSPLMGITNAISSVIIVGAVLALGTAEASGFSRVLAFFAVVLASINIFGGFIITRRMLAMFKKKEAHK